MGTGQATGGISTGGGRQTCRLWHRPEAHLGEVSYLFREVMGTTGLQFQGSSLACYFVREPVRNISHSGRPLDADRAGVETKLMSSPCPGATKSMDARLATSRNETRHPCTSHKKKHPHATCEVHGAPGPQDLNGPVSWILSLQQSWKWTGGFPRGK